MCNNIYIYILILIIIAIIVSLGYYLYKNLMSYNTLIHNTINEFNKKDTTNNDSNNNTNNNNITNNNNNKDNNKDNNDEKFKYLYEPVEYYKSQKGKNMRNHIANFIGKYFNVNQELINEATHYANELHNSSLIIDDIQDGSLKRREMDCAHILYGMPVSLSSAYLNIFKILSNKANTNSSLINIDNFKELDEYRNLTNEQIKQLVSYKGLQIALKNAYLAHLGQALDIYWANKKIIPSEEEYYFMINAKTGLGFTSCLDLFYNLTTNISKDDYKKFNNVLTKFSQFFQIRDDYINITDPDFWAKKGFCEDFDEKKYSYLIIKYNNNLLVSKEDKEDFFNLFYKNKLTNLEKSALIKKLELASIFNETFDLLVKLKEEINNTVNLDFIFDMLPINKFDIECIKDFC